MRTTENDLDRITEGPAGLPFTYGMDGSPLTTRQAAELYEDLEKRTLEKSELTLPDGRPGIVRTICLVFDDRLATCTADELPENYVPEIFASALYVNDDRAVRPLWKYSYPEEARAGHREAVAEAASGRVPVPAPFAGGAVR